MHWSSLLFVICGRCLVTYQLMVKAVILIAYAICSISLLGILLLLLPWNIVIIVLILVVAQKAFLFVLKIYHNVLPFPFSRHPANLSAFHSSDCKIKYCLYVIKHGLDAHL